MKLVAFDIFEYTLPLAQPLVTKDHKLTSRSGLLIKLSSAASQVGWGEIAPLPGFSRESLASAKQEILRLRPTLIGADLPDDTTPSAAASDRSILRSGLSPAVRCGLELALWNLHGSQEPPKKVLVNGLLTGSRDQVLESAREMVKAGYRAVKLKVGQHPTDEEIEITRKVRDIIGNDVTLRLDANRAWDLDQAVKFGRAITSCKIEYIEEPTADPKEFEAFSSKSGVAVALDETLLELRGKTLNQLRGVKAIVLKPTLLGGFRKARRLAEDAWSLGMQPVVSSCFESGVGIVGLARLAAFLSLENIPAGLDTYRWLKKDLLSRRLEIDSGWIQVGLNKAPEVNENLLRRITDG